MNNKIAKNYLYNLIYQVAVLIIPIITAPYLARILGAEGIGIYSYNYSIAYYFCLAVMLGINNYGNRSIAKCLGDKKQIDKTFSEIYSLQLFLGITVLIAYLAYSMFWCRDSLTALCYVPFILSYALDVNWLFFGQENFKIILFRNLIIKVLTASLIFGLIKTSSDVHTYIMIMSGGALLSQIIIWPIVLKQHRFSVPAVRDILKHLRPILILFIPVIAVSIYRTMDKIMLGTMANMTQVGYYENAEKIISILLSFITALGTVMLPRMAALFERNDQEQIKKMIGSSFAFVSLAASVIAFGVAAISDNFVVIYYGNNYFASGIILKLLCITIPFISYANIVRMQILIPQGKDRAYVISCFTGAVVNLIVNALLIPSYQAVGAALGTICAELCVLLVQVFSAKHEICLDGYVKSIAGFWRNGFFMFMLVSLVGLCKMNNIVTLCIQIIVGAAIVGILIIIQWKAFNDDYLGGILLRIFKRNRGL